MICGIGFVFSVLEWIASLIAIIKIGKNLKYDEENI